MPGRLRSWPAWPEFTPSKAEAKDDLVAIKKTIVDEYGQEALTKAWLKTCEALKTVTDDLAERGTGGIPQIEFEDFFKLSDEEKQRFKDIGCFVVRNVVSKEQADQWFADLKDYVAANKSNVSGSSDFVPVRFQSYVYSH
jgi:hypothetical protein